MSQREDQCGQLPQTACKSRRSYLSNGQLIFSRVGEPVVKYSSQILLYHVPHFFLYNCVCTAIIEYYRESTVPRSGHFNNVEQIVPEDSMGDEVSGHDLIVPCQS